MKFDGPLFTIGTEFQKNVWEALRDIPVGGKATYSQIASAIGAPDAVRAVGTACKVNPIAIIIPCHRVVKSNGDMGNYRWGKNNKLLLLQREEKFLKREDQTIATL